jgi:tRNA(Ile)-lysidine synthase
LNGLARPLSTLAVGLSGGPDSVALAHCAAQHARAHRLLLCFFHVHHGLHPLAGEWARVAERVGEVLTVPVHIARVTVDTSQGDGIEAAARDARYVALAGMARRHGADVVLLAHHQDDVAETVLHRLLRGSGIDGVRGMRTAFEMHDASFLRPWLALPRAPIRAHAQAWAACHELALADDPSNMDVRHARGALRRDVLPAIASHWPAYRTTLTRFARQAEAAADVLREVAQGDLAAITGSNGDWAIPRAEFPASVRLSGLLALSDARQAMALRAWFASCDLAMPSEARLHDLLAQLRTARADRQIAWSHAGWVVRRYRDDVILAPRAVEADAAMSVGISWQGEPSVSVPAFHGVLHVMPAAQGIDPAWLQGGVLAVRRRCGGERMQLRVDAPSRALKNLYQEHGVPAWQRAALPLLYRDDRLVFAAGLGSDVRVPQSAPGVALHWTAGHTGVALMA